MLSILKVHQTIQWNLFGCSSLLICNDARTNTHQTKRSWPPVLYKWKNLVNTTTEIKIIASTNVGEILWANIDLACVWRPRNLAETVTNMGGEKTEFQSNQLLHLRVYVLRPGKWKVSTKFSNSIASFQALSQSLLTNYPVIRVYAISASKTSSLNEPQ